MALAWLISSLALACAEPQACDIRRPKDCPASVLLDGSAPGLRFDGVGAVSARGTSRYLLDYSEETQKELLDTLFLPGYAASIQVLKVEIGGDAQSGLGVEPSHRRSENHIVCQRVKTFKLIREARQRNPELVVLASAWTLPAWVGVVNASQTGFYTEDTIDYLLSWIQCANSSGAGVVDYLGARPRRVVLDPLGRSWSQEAVPMDWARRLQSALDAQQLPTRLVLPDSEPQADSLRSVLDAKDTLSGGALGLHYPCFLPMPSLRDPPGVSFWSTEDGGMQADWAGAACAGRSINTNLVRMNVTSTFLRSLAWAVHPALPGTDDGLVSATEPWSGMYEVRDTLWVLAHTSRFTQVGWWVLPLQSGASGHLKKGGTFVTYLSPDRSSFTLVVEKLQAPCGSCSGATTQAEDVAFLLGGGLETPWVQRLMDNLESADNVTDNATEENGSDMADTPTNESDSSTNASNRSNRTEIPEDQGTGLGFFLTNKTHKLFRLPPLVVDSQGRFRFTVQADTIYTVTSLNHTDLPNATERMSNTTEAKAAFPIPYREDFDRYAVEDTPGYFADYGGSFQVAQDPSYSPNLVLKQGIEQKVGDNAYVAASEPITLIGHRLADGAVQVDVYLEEGTMPELKLMEPLRMGIQAAWNGNCLSSSALDRAPIFQEACKVKAQQNFAMDRGRILSSRSCMTAHMCSESSYRDRLVCVRECSENWLLRSNQSWVWRPDGSLRLQDRPELCLTQGDELPGETLRSLVLSACGEPISEKQRFLETQSELPVYVGLCLRLQPLPNQAPGELLNGLPGRNGYCLRLGLDAMGRGIWRLETGGAKARLLASGFVGTPRGAWHRLRLEGKGTLLRVHIDDESEVVAIDADHTRGAAALFSGWHPAYYDNFALDPAT